MIYNIGTLIKSRREELKISQEDLCAGICSISTLSRIENGHGVSTQSHATMLLQRLGYYDTTAFVFQSGEEIEMHNLQQKILHKHMLRKYSDAAEQLKELEKYKQHFDAMDKLFFELVSELLKTYASATPDKRNLENFERIIRITHPEYSLDSLPKVLTHYEALAMNNIAICYALDEQQNESLRIFEHLIDYYNSYVIDIELSKKFLPMAYYNASKILGMIGEYDRCIRMCDEAIEYCKFVQSFDEMPHLMYNKAWCMVRRKNPGDMETANHIAKQAYIVGTVFDNKPKLPGLLAELLKEFYNEDPPKI